MRTLADKMRDPEFRRTLLKLAADHDLLTTRFEEHLKPNQGHFPNANAPLPTN
jgi:hypothetical protein